MPLDQAAALAWVDAGCSVIPIKDDGSKAPRGPWKAAQAARAARDVVTGWLSGPGGLGVVCGAVSGHLEMLELEGRAVAEGYGEKLRQACRDNGVEDVLDVVMRGCRGKSPSGGYHFWYRVSDGPARGNTKLARRPGGAGVEVLIETRGEGGFAVVPPSNGTTHASGLPWVLDEGGPATIPTITAEQRDALHAVCTLLDEMPVEDQQPVTTTAPRLEGAAKRPGDDYNERASWDEILTPAGWTKLRRFGPGWAWRRPGKDGPGISATTGQSGDADRLYIFTTSTDLPSEQPLSKFWTYAQLQHGGDMRAATKALRAAGYGDPLPPRSDIRDLIAAPAPAADGASGDDGDTQGDDLETDRDGNYRGLRLIAASKFAIKRVRWLWEGRMAMGELSLIAGREGIGKSTAAYWLAARVSQGELEGEHFGEPRGVLVCATEDSWEHTIVPRLIAAGADLDRVHCIEMEDVAGHALGIELPLDLERIALATETTGAALLLLDPLMSRLDGKLDTHKDGEVRRALEPLVAMCHAVGLSTIGLIHLNKSSTTDPLNAVMGSRAFSAVARSVSLVVRDPADEEERRRLFGTPKNNLGRDDLPLLPFTVTGHPIDTEDDEGAIWTSRIEWQDPEDGTIQSAMEQAAEGRDARSATDEALDWLSDWLATQGGEAPSRDAKQSGAKEGHSADSLKRAVRKTRDIAIRSEGMPRRTVWYLTNADKSQSEHARGGSHPTAPTAPTDPDLHVCDEDSAPTALTSGSSWSSGRSPRASAPTACPHCNGRHDIHSATCPSRVTAHPGGAVG